MLINTVQRAKGLVTFVSLTFGVKFGLRELRANSSAQIFPDIYLEFKLEELTTPASTRRMSLDSEFRAA